MPTQEDLLLAILRVQVASARLTIARLRDVDASVELASLEKAADKAEAKANGVEEYVD